MIPTPIARLRILQMRIFFLAALMVALIAQDPSKQDTTHGPKVDAVVGKECRF